MRIDKYLAEHSFCSRTKAARALSKGLVTLNGKVAKASDDVSDGDAVEVRAEEVGFVSEGGQKYTRHCKHLGSQFRGKFLLISVRVQVALRTAFYKKGRRASMPSMWARVSLPSTWRKTAVFL